MPVPIAVTHPQGKGITAAHASELQTEGPFARVAAKRAAGEQNGQQPTANGHTQQAEAAATGQEASSGNISVQHLSFSYPGLG